MDGFPDPWAGVLHGYEQLGAFLDVTQIGHEIRTDWTRRQMLLLLVAAAPVNDVRQDFLKLYTRHGRLFSLEPGLAQSLEVGQDLSLRTWFTSHLADSRHLISRDGLPYLFAALCAWLSLRSSRSFMRALCSCDLLLPMEQPIISAISLCS